MRVEHDLSAPKIAAIRTIEDTLAGIWAQVLGLESVGAEDDFFRLGGDSFQIMQIVAEARKHGLIISPRVFYEHRTVTALAATAEGAAENERH